jgi:hypothetical protein
LSLLNINILAEVENPSPQLIFGNFIPTCEGKLRFSIVGAVFQKPLLPSFNNILKKEDRKKLLL